MTFLELAELVAEEVNGVAVPFSSTNLGKDENGDYIITDPIQRRSIRAVQRSFDWIINYSKYWEFLNQRGKLLDVASGVSEYTKPTVASVEWDSLYLTRSDSTAHWPVVKESYNSWQTRRTTQPATTGTPIHLIDAPGPKWILWPTPTQAWQLNGNYQLATPRLEDASDEPPWDEKFHDLVALGAVVLLEQREMAQEEVQTARSTAAARKAFENLWQPFVEMYLPVLGGPCGS